MSRRTRPKLFAFAREVELGRAQDLEDPQARALLEAVVDAFIAVCDDKTLTADRLAPILRAARHPESALQWSAMSRIITLSHYFPEAVDALGELAADPDPEVRRLTCAFAAAAPTGVLIPLLDHFLHDDDWTLRKEAARVASQVPLADLLPVVQRHLPRERDARVRVLLQVAERFLQQLPPEAD